MHEELKNTLREQGSRYPLMQPQDAVKLIYQNEFGPGHLMADAEAVRLRLWDEWKSLPQGSAPQRIEKIGNRLVRVHLAGMEESALEPLFHAFLLTAEEVHGSREGFLEKLTVLRSETQQGNLPFSPLQLQTYLAGYAAENAPMVRHSAIYRKAYSPAYRVVFRHLINCN